MSKASKRERQRLNREARREYEDKQAKRRRTMKAGRRVGIVAAPVIIALIVISVVNSGGSSSSSGAGGCQHASTPPAKHPHLSAPTQRISPSVPYQASIQTSCGTIQVSLDASQYPKAVNNFVYLANQGFYDNMAFVRAVKNAGIQAGSPDQSNQSSNTGPGYSAQAETPTTRPGQPAYPIGTVAFAKTGNDPAGTVDSQFFVVTGAQFTALPPDYAIIGQVTGGLPVAKKIQSFAPAAGDGPLTTHVVIKKVKITSGVSATPTT